MIITTISLKLAKPSVVSSLKPSRLPKDIALLNNPLLCISRIYAVFKELINP